MPRGEAPPVDRSALRRAFEEAGRADATVTASAFLFALARVLDVPLDEAAAAMEAAIDLGLVLRHGDAVRAAP